MLPRQNLEANGAVEANLRPFFFGGSLYFECYATMPMFADAHISSLGYLWLRVRYVLFSIGDVLGEGMRDWVTNFYVRI